MAPPAPTCTRHYLKHTNSFYGTDFWLIHGLIQHKTTIKPYIIHILPHNFLISVFGGSGEWVFLIGCGRGSFWYLYLLDYGKKVVYLHQKRYHIMPKLGVVQSKTVQYSISGTIVYMRERQGLSQTEVASRAGVSRRVYQRIEGGSFSQEELISVLTALGLEIEIRVGGSLLYGG